MAIPPEAIKIVTVLGPGVIKIGKELWDKTGSKVKTGAFQDCPLDMFGDKACIVTNPKQGGVVLLTSETIASYEFVKEKHKKAKFKTYYYYEITFKDGQKSYVRMSSKYRNAMLSHT